MKEQKNDPLGSCRNLIQIPPLPITQNIPPTPIPTSGIRQNLGEINGKNCFQQIFFSWVYNLLSRCGEGNMKIENTPSLPSHLRAQYQFQIYLKNKEQLNQMGALRMALKQFGGQLGLLVFLCFIVEVFYLSYPIVIYYCVDYIENRRSDTRQGIILFAITILVSFFYNLTYRNLKYRFKSLGVNLSTHFNILIYHKSLNYSFIADNRFSEGDVISLSQIDTDNLMYVGSKLAYFVFGTIEIFLGFGLLYWFIGVSFIAGLIILIVVSAITFFVSLYGITVTQKALQSRDGRISATQQVLKIIRFIKLNAMEKFYFNKIQQKREEELTNFRKKGIVQIALIFLYFLTAPLMLTGIIVTYILINGDITPAKVFTTMMICVVFEVTAQALPKAISQLLAVLKSLERITQFLQAPEISSNNYKRGQSDDKQLSVCIKEGNFYLYSNEQKNKVENKEIFPIHFNPQNKIPNLQPKQCLFNDGKQIVTAQQLTSQRNLKNKASNQPINKEQVLLLKDVNLSIKRGKINMIFGDIGSGKSMLLLSILNQLKSKQSTSVQVNGKLAFVSQKPWIFTDTLLSNIIFTFQKQQNLLQQVINYSCLAADLKQMPNGINTQIGQNGINLSGGQKFRVDFARSLYSRSDIYLYDDILSAVDIHVGTFIMDQTIKKYLAGKTVILATHAIKYAEKADNIILMKNGEIVSSGSYSSISSTYQFSQLKAKIVARQTEKEKPVLQKSLKAMLSQALQESQVITSQQQKEQIADQIVAQIQQQNMAIVEDLIIPEDQEGGRVNFKIFTQYIKLNGGYCKYLVPILLCFVIYSGLQTTASIILSKWSEGYGEDKKLLYIFIALTISANLFIIFQSIILLLSGVQQGRVVHKNIFKRLLYASLNNFYNRVPLGRLLNRLGKDLKQIDESISNTLSSSLLTFFRTISALVISIYASTFFALIPIVIVIFLFWKIRNFYLQGQTQLIRLQKITNSPLVISFTTGIRGAVSIRSYGSCQRYLKEHIRVVNDFKRVQFNRFAIEGWFILVLIGLLYIVNMFTIGFTMFSPTTNPSYLGLLLIYVLNLNDELFQFVLDQAQFQTQLVSLERIYSLMSLAPEKKYVQYCQKWQQKQQYLKKQIVLGEIQFKQVTARYRVDLPSVLKAVTCKINPGQKIGIVGRTGSGKTTLLNTIICMTQIYGGSILIDKKNINAISVKNLRKQITVIDQQPVLMNSTFRENLDVFNQYTDDELIRVMRQCNILDIVQKRGGLSGEVTNNSLSSGQKQLLSICRALLKNTKIVLIDEATANVDVKNDALIQSVLEKNFIGKTILTIAHRLSTLERYDKIMVMDSGRLIQFGTPQELMSKRGIYYEMIKKYETSQNGISQMLK